MEALKHLIECNCILAQFAKSPSPPFHKFVVFSQVEDDGRVLEKHAQCSNCGAIHRVYDVCKSEVIPRKESSAIVMTIDDVKPSLSKDICDLLEKNNCDVSTWEHVQFLIENQKWGEHVVLSSEKTSTGKEGKILRILGNSLFRVQPFTITNEVEIG